MAGLLAFGLVAAACMICYILLPSTSAQVASPSSGDINRLYIVNNRADSVSVINGITSQMMDSIEVGNAPYAVAVNPVLHKAYIANSGSDTVSVIDTLENVVKGEVAVGMNPVAAAINLATNMTYIANYDDDTVSVMDSDDTIINTFETGASPISIAANQDNNAVYVVSYDGNAVYVIDGSTGEEIARVAVGMNPQGIALDTSRNKIYVTNTNSDSVSVIDATNYEVLTTIEVGVTPYAVAFNPVNNMVYVANGNTNTVSVINSATNGIVKEVSVGSTPFHISVNPSTNRIYVINSASENITVLDGFSNNVVSSFETQGGPLDIAAVFGQIDLAPAPDVEEEPEIDQSDAGSFAISAKLPAFNVEPGGSQTQYMEVRWTGSKTISIVDVEFSSNSDWFTIEPLPVKATAGQNNMMKRFVAIEVTPPIGTEEKDVRIDVVVSAVAGSERAIATAPLNISLVSTSTIALYIIAGVGVVAAGAVVAWTKIRKH